LGVLDRVELVGSRLDRPGRSIRLMLKQFLYPNAQIRKQKMARIWFFKSEILHFFDGVSLTFRCAAFSRGEDNELATGVAQR
jgi:hypothetical protein